MRKRTVSIMLALVITSASISFTACGEDQIKFVKQKVVDLSIYTDAGLQLCSEFERDKILTPDQAQTARAALTQIKDTLGIFIERAKSYTKIDLSSRAELARLFGDVVAGVREVISKAKPLIVAALTALGVQDAEKLLSKASVLFTAIETTTRLIESRLTN
ncbi:MAG: hypothetical protein AB1631_23535 [Acidobacteriota bacterium]